MNEVIDFFKGLGFKVSESNTNDFHFYMNLWINDVGQIDAQGDSETVSMRLIGREPYDHADFLASNKEGIIKKIEDWKNGNW